MNQDFLTVLFYVFSIFDLFIFLSVVIFRCSRDLYNTNMLFSMGFANTNADTVVVIFEWCDMLLGNRRLSLRVSVLQ